jgi:hypothetical protein
MTASRILSAAVAATALAAAASAATTEVFVDDAPSDFMAGDFTTSTLSMEGVLSPPPKREVLARLPEDEIVWDIAAGRDGTTYAATGHKGRLRAIAADGTVRAIADFDEPALYALLARANGTLLVGASPSGIVYSLDPSKEDAKPEVFSRTGQRFLWELAELGDGTVIAATGPEARLLSIDAKGTTATLAQIPGATNIVDVQRGPDGTYTVGTQGRGLVARVFHDGSIRILADAEQDEVRRVLLRNDGVVIAAVNGRRAPGERFLKPANANSDAKPRDESFLLSITPEGFASEIFTSPETPIHDIALGPEGRVLLAGGSRGALLLVGDTGDSAIAGGTGESVGVRLAPDGKGSILIGTGDAASVQRLSLGERGNGEFTSRVFGASSTARWGRVHGMASTPPGTRILISTRSGNTPAPDSTWSPWSEPQDFASATSVTRSPAARFLQYRLQLEGTAEAFPSLDAIRLYYAEANQPPLITTLEAKPVPRERSKEEPPRRSGPVNSTPGSATRSIELTWKAEDPDGDPLAYMVELQRGGSDRWHVLEERLSGTTFRIDTIGLPDGPARFRVTADDRDGNWRGYEKTHARTTNWLTVDNTPPEIVALEWDRVAPGRVEVRAKAVDASIIAGAAWRADTNSWRPLQPDDNIFDDRTENFLLELRGEDTRPGTAITVHITDETGNTAARSVTLE